jgi:hypothetical protein
VLRRRLLIEAILKGKFMPIQDALPILGFVKGLATNAIGDSDPINVPQVGRGYVVQAVYAYNGTGDNTLTAVGVFGAPAGAGAVIVANAALGAAHATSSGVTARTVAATAVTPAVTADNLYVRVGTVSGIPGTTIDVVIYGYALP